MRLSVILLVVGLVIGGLVGYATRPEAAEIKIGPLQVEVQSNQAAGPRQGGALTSGQLQHVGLFAVGGAVLGLLIGFAADRRRA